MGILYLVQPAELRDTNRFKIGCSKKCDLSRVQKGYKKDTRYLHILEVENPHYVERKLIKHMDKKFRKFGTSEYYEADEIEIRLAFVDFVTKQYLRDEAGEDEIVDDTFWEGGLDEDDVEWSDYESSDSSSSFENNSFSSSSEEENHIIKQKTKTKVNVKISVNSKGSSKSKKEIDSD